jgi:hypothetical protein
MRWPGAAAFWSVTNSFEPSAAVTAVRAMIGKLYRCRVKAAEGVGEAKLSNQTCQGPGGPGEAGGGVGGGDVGVEVTHQHGGDGAALEMGPQGGEEGLPLLEGTGRGVKVNEGEAADGEKLGVPGPQNRHRRPREAGQNGDGPAGLVSGQENLVPEGLGQGREGGVGTHLLEEDDGRVVLPEQGGQAAQVAPAGGVEREEGK